MYVKGSYVLSCEEVKYNNVKHIYLGIKKTQNNDLNSSLCLLHHFYLSLNSSNFSLDCQSI